MTDLRDKLQVTQWKSTNEVLEWFASLKYTKESIKNQMLKFIKFNIEAFYPSISEELLNKSIHFAQINGVFFSETDIETVKTARESVLFKNGVPYVKKGRNNRFDVNIGSWDGVEISELCGVYLLNRLTDENGPFEKSSVGLYRDDGLSVAKGTERTRNQIQKWIEAIFNEEGLKITSDINMTETDFLDVKLNLETQ